MAKKDRKGVVQLVTDKNKNQPVKYGRDGRRMHPKSLKNVEDKSNGLQAHPENINRNGRPPDPIEVVRHRLSNIFQEPYWEKNKKNEETVVLILKDAIESYFKEKDTTKKQRWYDLIVGGSTSGKGQIAQPNNNANGMNVQNVIILPALKETKVVLNAQETDYEV